MKVGQDVHFVGGNVEDAVNEGVRRGYVDGYLRKSVVRDPIYREIPGIIHRQSFITVLFPETALLSLLHRKVLEVKI